MHNEIVKVFDGRELMIEKIDDENFYLHVTSIAREKGKNFSDWEHKDAEYIQKIKKNLNVENPTFKGNLIETRAGRNGFTKIHNKLIVSYARFISVDFAIWADTMVFDILTGKKQLQLENQTKKLKEIENKYSKQISDLKCEANKKTQHKLITYRDQTQSLRKWVQDKFPNYEIKEKDLWRFLEDHRDEIVTEVPARSSRKILKNLDLGKEVGSSIAFNEDVLVYISEFVGEANLTKKPQQGTFEF